MEVVLRHADIGVSHDTLDGSQVHTKRLHLADIGVSAAVWRQEGYFGNGLQSLFELVTEMSRITRAVFLSYFPDKLLIRIPQGNRAVAQAFRYRDAPVTVAGLGRTYNTGALVHVDGLLNADDRSIRFDMPGFQSQNLLGAHSGSKHQPDAEPHTVFRQFFHEDSYLFRGKGILPLYGFPVAHLLCEANRVLSDEIAGFGLVHDLIHHSPALSQIVKRASVMAKLLQHHFDVEGFDVPDLPAAEKGFECTQRVFVVFLRGGHDVVFVAFKPHVLNLAALENTEVYNNIYEFLSNAIPTSNGVTILAVEEPESHLHPIFQRLLYRHIMNKANTSVMVTTHSTHISSVAPITSLVHLIATKDGTCVNTTANLKLSEIDFSDLSRYIDVKRGEVYTAKGVIFVEGIAEEYLIPSFAKAMGLDLDRLGVVVCNVNSTNFKPYCDFADALGIPYVIVTDGDYYHIEADKKLYNDLEDISHGNKGFDGLDRCYDMFSDTDADYDQWNFSDRREYFAALGAFVGEYTLEVDIFKTANENDQKIISSVFNQLTKGGERQKRNFENELSTGQYNTCLAKIESSHSGIGKGRFAQRLANMVSETMIPRYISKAIESIAAKVR